MSSVQVPAAPLPAVESARTLPGVRVGPNNPRRYAREARSGDRRGPCSPSPPSRSAWPGTCSTIFWFESFWLCNLSLGLVGLGLLSRSRLPVNVGFVWLLPGTLAWASEAAFLGGSFAPTSYLVHLAGTALAAFGVARLGVHRRTELAALAFLCTVLLLARCLPASANVNCAFRARSGWSLLPEERGALLRMRRAACARDQHCFRRGSPDASSKAPERARRLGRRLQFGERSRLRGGSRAAVNPARLGGRCRVESATCCRGSRTWSRAPQRRRAPPSRAGPRILLEPVGAEVERASPSSLYRNRRRTVRIDRGRSTRRSSDAAFARL